MRWKIALVACVVVGGAACDGDGSTEPTAPPTVPPDTAATTAAPEYRPADPCALITEAEVASATGLEVVGVEAQPPITCLFDLIDDAGVDIFVVVEDGAGRLGGPAALMEDYAAHIGSGALEVADVGNRAIYDEEFRTIVVDAGGGAMFAIGVNGGFEALTDPRSELIDLARLATERSG